MGRFVGLGLFVLLIAVVIVNAQKGLSRNVRSQCLGNVMRVDIGPLQGNTLDVAAVMNDTIIYLDPFIATMCGFSMTVNRLGTTRIYASLLNCFAEKSEDRIYTMKLLLHVHGNQMAEDEVYHVSETCVYTTWASREIFCDSDYMQVSVKRAAPNDYVLPKHPANKDKSRFGDPQRATEKTRPNVVSVMFFTPAERIMKVGDAQRQGYLAENTPTRLFFRSPKTTPETYTQNVAGVPMTVLKASTTSKNKGLLTQLAVTAACPILEGSVSYSPNTISWFLPKHIDPLISSSPFLLEVHMGVNGQRLDAAEMAARHYTLTVNDIYVIVEIPIGAVGGYFQCRVEDDRCLTSYTIEPMIEMLWTEGSTHEDTRYKVLLPITTRLPYRPPQVIDNTVPEERIFKVVLGPFSPDVALMNITFPSEVLSVADCHARNINVLEMSPNSSSKVFILEVPFTDRVVLQMREMGTTVYNLHMTLGLVCLPHYTPFSHTAHLEAKLVDAVAPSISGACGYQSFYILVKYGTASFQTTVGNQILTPQLAQQYNFTRNETHFSFAVPFFSPNVVFESLQSSTLGNRLDVVLSNPKTGQKIGEFSLACNSISPLTECFPNGTITAWAVKLESVPSLNPSLLTLNDPACGPVFSDDRYAYFVFTANSCGTTRKFLPNKMLYENEISLPDELSKNEDLEFQLKVSCYYDINQTHAVALNPRPRRSEPFTENAKGELKLEMRLASDNSYSRFHSMEDYPVAKYLQQPLYFEVQLMRSTNSKVSVELENCWATLDEDRMSQPRWNLIINGCPNPADPYQFIFHPVLPDDRVQYPSHFKRFEVSMFAFSEDKETLSPQVFVHCDVVICDATNPQGGVCAGLCSHQENKIKGQRRSVSEEDVHHVSSGPITLT